MILFLLTNRRYSLKHPLQYLVGYFRSCLVDPKCYICNKINIFSDLYNKSTYEIQSILKRRRLNLNFGACQVHLPPVASDRDITVEESTVYDAFLKSNFIELHDFY